jgi:protein import protein ZIM17
MSKASYTKGVVLVRCPGCENLHLMADNLGWFGKPGSVESFLAERGDKVRKGVEGDYEFTAEDLTGWGGTEFHKVGASETGSDEG